MTLIDKAEALLPCPFCGGDDLYFPHGTDPAVIECSGCGARSGVPDEQTEAAAIAAWNRRAPHVNETPKSEHDAGGVLTAQPLIDAAVAKALEDAVNEINCGCTIESGGCRWPHACPQEDVAAIRALIPASGTDALRQARVEGMRRLADELEDIIDEAENIGWSSIRDDIAALIAREATP